MIMPDRPATNNLFLLGAGFDRALYGPDIPLNGQVIPWLKNKFEYAPWTAHLARYQTTDIERSLTYLDLEVTAPPANTSENDRLTLRRWIEQTIARFFTDFRITPEIASKDWALTFAKAVLDKNDAIVNLNYTPLLEGLLDTAGVWTPHGGYSRFIENGVLEATSGPVRQNSLLKNIIVYKIHGSTHFHLSSVNENHEETAIGFSFNDSIFPRSGKHTNFGPGVPDLGRYVIAPSFIKTWHIQIAGMMNEVLERVNMAKNIIILGCGMRPEDNFLFLMFANFLRAANPGGKIIVVDPNASQVVKNIRTYSNWLWDGISQQVVKIEKELDLESVEQLHDQLAATKSEEGPNARIRAHTPDPHRRTPPRGP